MSDGMHRPPPFAMSAGGTRPLFEAVVAHVEERFAHTKSRRTDPTWDTKALINFSAATKAQLERIAARATDRVCHGVYPMQVAAILLELALGEKDD